MNLRLTIHELTGALNLTPRQRLALEEIAGLDGQSTLPARLPQVTALLGAALIGLGVILWLAANWPDLGRMTKFALLEALIVASAVGALWKAEARPALLLVTLLAQGGVLAFFGQTYQTGADAWQLFALWAALGLPLALAARHDTAWLPWILVGMLAVTLWTSTTAGPPWRMQGEASGIHFASWAMDAALILLVAPIAAIRCLTGAGVWSFRAAVLLTACHISTAALSALFASNPAAHYGAGSFVLLVAAAIFASLLYDIFALSVVVLAFDVLLIAGAARYLFDAVHGEVATFLMLGLFSAGVVAVSASAVRTLSRRHDSPDSTDGVSP